MAADRARGALALAIALVACSAPSETTRSRALPLTAGMPSPAHPEVVAIGVRPQLCERDLVPSCTGTLIAPRVVLTAAHCVDRPEAFSVFFGPRVDGEGVLRDVAAVRLHPSWSDGEGDVDLAVLLLDRDAPTAPIALADSKSPRVALDDTLTVVGFGATAVREVPDGIKRAGTSRVSVLEAESFRMIPAPTLICDGDSGGPVIATRDGVDTLVGVTIEGDAECMAWSRHEDVAAHRSFIDAASAEPAPPLVQPADLCSRSCTRDRDCPPFHECEQDELGQPRCALAPLPVGGVGTACSSNGTCGGAPCVRTFGSDACHCLVSCLANTNSNASGYRAGGGGCSVAAPGL